MGLFDSLIVILSLSLVTLMIFNRLNIPTLLGFLLIGIAAGPYSFALIPDTQTTREIAEIGSALLLFTIGLEFSLKKLMSLKDIVFIIGALQVSLTILICFTIGRFIGLTPLEAFIVGSTIAMSSTAMTAKILKEQHALNLPHGMQAIGILLFQDLAVVPVFVVIPYFAVTATKATGLALFYPLLKGTIAISLILYGGKRLLNTLFDAIAKQHSEELFTLAVLIVALASSWLTHALGLSYALGAFLAGMILSETAFRHQIAVDIRPFKDLLLGFFFISIGMQVNLFQVFESWPWALITVLAFILLKALLISGISWVVKKDWTTAIHTGLILAHGGEFSFAILGLSMQYGVLSSEYNQVVLSAIFFSMLVAPFLITHSKTLVGWLSPLKQDNKHNLPFAINPNELHQFKDHVVICGFGRVGQNVATMLRQCDIPFVALDLDINRVKQAYLGGDNVYYGNACHMQILQALNIQQAKAITITFQSNQTLNAIKQIENNWPHIKLIVRSHDESDIESFVEAGATEVIPESLEASLMMSFHLLLLLKVPGDKVINLVEKARQSRYEILRYIFPNFEEKTSNNQKTVLHVQAAPEILLGMTIAEIEKQYSSIKVVRLKRHNKILTSKNSRLQKGDILTVFAKQSDLTALWS